MEKKKEAKKEMKRVSWTNNKTVPEHILLYELDLVNQKVATKTGQLPAVFFLRNCLSFTSSAAIFLYHSNQKEVRGFC